MSSFTEALLLLAASHVFLIGAILLRRHRRDRSAVASSLFTFAVVCHLVLPLLLRHRAPAVLVSLALLGEIAHPFAFWVVARVHFDDDFSLLPRHWWFLAALEGVGYVCWLLTRESGTLEISRAEPVVWVLLPKLLSLVVTLHACLHVYLGCRGDLVLSRLKLRYGVLLVCGGYLLIEALFEVLLQGSEARALAEQTHAVTSFVLAFGVSLASLAAPDLLKPSVILAPGPILEPQLAERLQQLIEVEQVFREEGLTISTLAARLDAQEYRVRQLINSQLGFRNFNAFLNHYRVREARKTLGDPARRHLGIAQVAYEVGYSSLGPFNKAFKERTGRTPSEFRAQVSVEDAS